MRASFSRHSYDLVERNWIDMSSTAIINAKT